jgi:hypothetical protein
VKTKFCCIFVRSTKIQNFIATTKIAAGHIRSFCVHKRLEGKGKMPGPAEEQRPKINSSIGRGKQKIEVVKEMGEGRGWPWDGWAKNELNE